MCHTFVTKLRYATYIITCSSPVFPCIKEGTNTATLGAAMPAAENAGINLDNKG
jgi:hypothetical protein